MPLSGKQWVKLLQKAGWRCLRIAGSHCIIGKEGHCNVPVPVHGNRPLKKGTEHNTRKLSGLKK